MIKRHLLNYFLISMLTFFYDITLHGFIDIEQAAKYAHDHAEYPAPDNNDLSAPNYATFYRSQTSGFFSLLAQKIGLKEKSVWTVQGFKKTLEDVIAQRENMGYKGRFVEKIIPVAQSNIIVFGDIFGAFHSLVRNVQELVRLGIVNNEFKIIKNDTYIVFNGNVIDLSPYILETLTLLLDLMRANPENVFYIKGKHEDAGLWHNFGLQQELELRASRFSSEKIPFSSLIDQFFNTLPLALYVVGLQNGAKEMMRISPANRSSTELDEEVYGNFFNETNKPDMRLVTRKELSSKIVPIKTIIKARENLATYPPSNGLLSLDQDKDSFAWALFSSPTLTNRALYGFFYDAFTIIRVTEEFNDWTISVYNRDVREIKGFTLAGEFNLITGKKIEQKKQSSVEQRAKEEQSKVLATESKLASQGAPDTTADIMIGTSLDLSKGLRVESQLSLNGCNLAIDRANRAGGVQGRKIKLVALDDQYDPKKGRENVELLKNKYNISIILSPMGETSLQGYMDQVKEEKLVVIFPISGAISLRDPKIQFMIHFRPSYDAIYTALLKYAKDELHGKKMAIVYETDLSSDGIKDHIKNAGILQTDLLEVAYDPAITEFKEQADAIKNFNPDTIVFLGTSRNTEKILDAIGIENMLNKNLLGDELGDAAFIKYLIDRGLSKQFIDAENIPNPTTSNLEILREYRQDIGDAANIEPCSAETYVTTSIFIEALRRINGPITDKAIIEVLENTKNYNFKGFELNFNPATRELSRDIWLNTGKPDWLKLVVTPDIVQQKKEHVSKVTEKVTHHEKSEENQEEVVVGATLDLSKAASVIGKDVLKGLRKAFDKANKEGGVNGKSIRLIALDDEDSPAIAKQNAEKFIEKYGTDLILSPLEATSIQGLLDLIRDGKILLLFPCTGSSILEDPSLKNIITIRSWYSDADTALFLYVHNVWNTKRFAWFASDDPTNSGLKEHLEAAHLPQGSYKIFLFNPALLNLDDIRKELVEYQPDVLGLASGTQASIELLRQVGPTFLLNIKIIGQKYDELFKSFLQQKGLEKRYFEIENLPDPEKSNLPIAVEYRQEMVSEQLNYSSFEGYVNGMLFVELVRLTKGPITKENLIKTAQGLKNYNFKGLMLTYNNRQLFNTLWIDEGKGEWAAINVTELLKQQ